MASNTDKSPHILNASSNLVGLCFIVLTSMKLLKISQTTFIDEITTFALICFMASCLLSFLAIRKGDVEGNMFETIADIFFLVGLFILFVSTILFSFVFEIAQ